MAELARNFFTLNVNPVLIGAGATAQVYLNLNNYDNFVLFLTQNLQQAVWAGIAESMGYTR